MKKNKKSLKKPIIATSIAAFSYVSYKILKNKYPDKLNNINNSFKNILNKKDSLSMENKEKSNQIVENTVLEEKIENNQLEESIINDFDENNEQINSNNNFNENYNLDSTPEYNNIYDEENSNTEYSDKNITRIFIDKLEYNEKIKENLQKHIDNVINDDSNIKIPDEYIEDEIRYQLCLTNKEEITKKTLSRLERIDFFEISDNDLNIYCDFLNKYTNIKSIVIESLNPFKYGTENNSQITTTCLKNISPINNLSSLEELSFNWGIENIDFSVLTNLSNLKKLEIKYGMLNNIDFIANFPNLNYIEVMLSNNVTNFSPLLNLKNLQTIHIYSNKKLDTNIFKNITSLKYLYINGERIAI